jgi:hypothetical protein
MQTNRAGQDAGAEKLMRIKELYADAPELGKAALRDGVAALKKEFGLGEADQDAAAATQGRTAGRIGARRGKLSELTGIMQLVPGGGRRIRGLLDIADGNFKGADLVGTLHDMRFVLLNDDTTLLFATTYDGDWDAYIDDFATKIPHSMDLLFCNCEGWPGIRSPSVKDWIVARQHPAAGWYVANPNLTVAETRRLAKVGKAMDELLDKIG